MKREGWSCGWGGGGGGGGGGGARIAMLGIRAVGFAQGEGGFSKLVSQPGWWGRERGTRLGEGASGTRRGDQGSGTGEIESRTDVRWWKVRAVSACSWGRERT